MADQISKCKSCGDELPPYPGRGPKREYCHRASCNSNGRTKRINYKVTRYTTSWTKWGGARKNIKKEKLDRWYCQACKNEQPGEMPAYMFPIGYGDFIRICSDCQNKVIDGLIEKASDLMKKVRFNL